MARAGVRRRPWMADDLCVRSSNRHLMDRANTFRLSLCHESGPFSLNLKRMPNGVVFRGTPIPPGTAVFACHLRRRGQRHQPRLPDHFQQPSPRQRTGSGSAPGSGLGDGRRGRCWLDQSSRSAASMNGRPGIGANDLLQVPRPAPWRRSPPIRLRDTAKNKKCCPSPRLHPRLVGSCAGRSAESGARELAPPLARSLPEEDGGGEPGQAGDARDHRADR